MHYLDSIFSWLIHRLAGRRSKEDSSLLYRDGIVGLGAAVRTRASTAFLWGGRISNRRYFTQGANTIAPITAMLRSWWHIDGGQETIPGGGADEELMRRKLRGGIGE